MPVKNYENYLKILEEKLILIYDMSSEEAHNAVYSSATEKMLHKKEEAAWQMHQPLEITVEEIYREYKRLPLDSE